MFNNNISEVLIIGSVANYYQLLSVSVLLLCYVTHIIIRLLIMSPLMITI